MKLLLITAIKEFEKDILQILKKAKVKSFSYKNVNGFKDSSDDAIEASWFATSNQENESVMFYAFVEKEKVDSVFELADHFNSNQKTVSHVHIAVLNIEKSN